MASPNSPGDLEWYQIISREVFTHFVINLPRKVSDELKSKHFMDRELFIRLTISLGRDITQVMKVIALWIWLEQFGYPNLVVKLLEQVDEMVIVVMSEAVSCIHYIEMATTPPPPDTDDIPMTHALMDEDISLQFFYENRNTALLGITKVINDICAKVFGDIVRIALAQNGPPSGEGSSRMGGVGAGGAGVQQGNSESRADEGGGSSSYESEGSPMPPPPPQTMGIVGGSSNVVSIWGVRDQQENSEGSTDEEEWSSDESD